MMTFVCFIVGGLMVGLAFVSGLMLGWNMAKNGEAKITLPVTPFAKSRKIGNLSEIELDIRERQQQADRARQMVQTRKVL